MEKQKTIQCRDCENMTLGSRENHTLCQDCRKAMQKRSKENYRDSHKEEAKEYKKWYRETHAEEIRVYEREYSKNNRNIRREIETRYKMRYPEKKKAHQLARSLPMESRCENCGHTQELQKHHPDYTQPLKIITLCKRCHTEAHQEVKI